jgi:cellulose synthase (UDP-forming)
MRIPAQVPVALHLDGDRNGEGLTTNISVGGAAMTTTSASGLEVGHHLRISFPQQTRSAQIGATVMGKTGDSIRLKFDATTIVEQETLTRALYSRANSWISLRAKGEEDRPLVSLGRVILISFTGFKRILLGLLPRRNTVGILLLAASLGLLHKSSSGQIPGTITTPEPPPATAQPITAPSAQTTPAADTTNIQLPPEVTASTADEKITLKDMGVQGAIDMHAPHSYYSVGFVLPNDRLPLHAALELSYHFSHSIVPHTGSIRAMVNGVPIGVIQAPEQPQAEGQFAFISFRVPPELLIRNNDITFEFTGGSVLQTESSARTAVLASIGATSRILVAGDHLPLKTDLGLLPQPFFDPDLQTTTTIPFVFLSSPSPRTLQAAAIVASWFGIQASSKPVRYTVSVGNIPAGNVVIFANGDLAKQPNLQVSAGGGALTITANPSDPDGSALVLSADDDSQLVTVARALALMKVSHLPPGQRPPSLGKSVRIGNFALPAQRKPDDAPRWLTTDKLTSLWATTSQQAMQSNGSKPLPVYFRVPPDLYYGEIENLNLRLNYRYNAMPLAPDSALRGFLNGSLISEVPLPPGSDFADRQRTVLVPVAKMRPFGNTFLFNFDFIPSNPNSDAQNGPNKLFGSILQESWLDIRGLDHWAPMPNLELFANAGFPFTRKADLSDTSVVMPVQPTAKEIELLLYVMSHCGMQTGYPVLRVDMVGPDAVMTSTHDYLIIGGVDDQPAFESLDPALPVTFDSNGIHVKESSGFLATLKQTWQKWTGGTQESQPSNVHGESDLMIEGLESPSYPGRSIVLLSLRNPQAVDEFADAFLERSQSSDISGSVSLLRNGKFNSFDMNTSTYHVGDISWYALMRLWFAQHFWLLLAAVSLLSLPLAGWIRDYLVWLAAKRVSVEDPA